MKNFSIKVISKPELEGKYLFSYGQITIGKFKERFRMSIAEWTVKEYKKQWREAIKRLKDHDSSCFIYSAANMKKSPFVWMYTLYKVENTVYVRERLIFDQIELHEPSLDLRKLNAQTCYDFIAPRKIDEGIWEVTVSLADIESFKVV